MKIVNKPEIVVANEEKAVIFEFLELLDREYCPASGGCNTCAFCRMGYCSAEQLEVSIRRCQLLIVKKCRFQKILKKLEMALDNLQELWYNKDTK